MPGLSRPGEPAIASKGQPETRRRTQKFLIKLHGADTDSVHRQQCTLRTPTVHRQPYTRCTPFLAQTVPTACTTPYTVWTLVNSVTTRRTLRTLASKQA